VAVVTSTGENTETDVTYIGKGKTLRQTGHRMRQLGVAALPVCGEDGKFQGIITRAVVVEAIAAGGDPQTVTVGEVASTRWPPSLRSQGGRAGVRRPGEVRGNRRVVPVTGDDWRTWEESGGDPARHRLELRIGELADAVRAATDAISQFSAVTTVPDPPARAVIGPGGTT
jgi:hypothetical protein